MKVIIPDLDFYVKECNFLIMKEAGAKGTIIRAGQRYWKDSRAPVFMKGAAEVHLPIGSYWYFDSRESPKNQARYWSEVLDGFHTPLYCWTDFEDSYNGAYSGWKNWYDFLEYSKQYMPGRSFGIYTGYYYWKDFGPNPLYFPREASYFGNYPLWLPWYTENKALIKIPTIWDKETFWQFTENGDGKLYGGLSDGMDLNEFNGTELEFIEYFKLETEEQGEPMPTTTTYRGTITWSEDVNVRKAPYVNNITNPVLYILHKGDVFTGVDIKVIVPGVEEWMQLVSGDWFALRYSGNLRGNYEVIPPSEEPLSPINNITIELSDGSAWKTNAFTKIK